MNTTAHAHTRPTLAAAFPKQAAQIDTERPLIARAIAEHVTVSWNDTQELVLHCDDDPSHQLLITPSQYQYLRTVFPTFASLAVVLALAPNIITPELVLDACEKERQASREKAAPRNQLAMEQVLALGNWLAQPANTKLAADDTDPVVAAAATEALKFTVTVPNIVRARKALNIQKTKPATPDPQTDLVELARRVSILETDGQNLNDLARRLIRLEVDQPMEITTLSRTFRIQTDGINATIAALRDFVDKLSSRLAALETSATL